MKKINLLLIMALMFAGITAKSQTQESTKFTKGMNKVTFKSEGLKVKAGDAIAVIGNSGELTTGPHLHFELWHNGVPLDPVKYIVF